MPANTDLEKTYDSGKVESEIHAQWESAGAFRATADPRPSDRRFVIVIPPPNVTGALHLGHAINNTLQDILIRWHRMRGDNTLWLPGVDHAGIATQAVVEKRLLEEEGLTRHEIGRERLVQRIWAWKDQYQQRIIHQLKLMGCSCDWSRTRFTLDDGLARAVRETFFRLFKDGLVFRGKRLVNWDTQLQTAVADDEVYHETVKGHFWHIKYPVMDPKPGEPEHVHIATTRPETMLGDTAVAVHPDPERFFTKRERELHEKRAGATGRDAKDIGAQLEALTERRAGHLPTLLKLRDMAADGRRVLLPLVDRPIPLIQDEWADPTKGSGCVKITPAHDPNDYEVGQRHALPMVSVLTADGRVADIVEPDGGRNPHSDRYAGLEFAGKGRHRVVADLEERGLLEKVEDHEMDVGHSDRSKKPIEPYLSDQWFVRMGDVDGGITLGDGSKAPGLAQAAMDAVSDGRLKVVPERYAKTYLDWLGEKRDWCISRQLWWGHRIPVWSKRMSLEEWPAWADRDKNSTLPVGSVGHDLAASVIRDDGTFHIVAGTDQAWEALVDLRDSTDPSEPLTWHVCLRNDEASLGTLPTPEMSWKDWLESNGFKRDPDVLDTWFSSQLWPFSTLDWPDWGDDQEYYYPGSVLITSRDIITLWVARMVLSGLYCTGEVPFPHTYIHAKILDGRGETMSKSKGNGVDPLDIIEVYGADALRYALADMTTEMQDVRMPVEYRCPHCHGLTVQTASNMHAKTLKCKPCGKTFATQWADEAAQAEHGRALMVSDKFEIGRNFCNKLWNAARFAFMNLDGVECNRLDVAALLPEDRWILAELDQAIVSSQQALAEYRYSASVRILRDFFWDSLCDWYIELTKPRMTGAAVDTAPSDEESELRAPVSGFGADATNADRHAAEARQVLAFCLDQVLRLLHPVLPFITERLWRQLNALAARRGLPGAAEPAGSDLLVLAEFPPTEGWPKLRDPAVLGLFADIQSVTRGVREMRNSWKVSPRQSVTVTVKAPPDHIDSLSAHAHIIRALANVGELSVVPDAKRPANAASAVIGGLSVYVHDVADDQTERRRITEELDQVNKLVEGKRRKLDNPNFVGNAAPEVVRAERGRLAELEARRQGLDSALAELGAPPP